MWDTVKAVLWGKCIELNAYARKEERSKINNLSFSLGKQEKKKKIKSKLTKGKEIIKIWAESNKTEIRNKETKSMKSKVGS